TQPACRNAPCPGTAGAGTRAEQRARAHRVVRLVQAYYHFSQRPRLIEEYPGRRTGAMHPTEVVEMSNRPFAFPARAMRLCIFTHPNWRFHIDEVSRTVHKHS